MQNYKKNVANFIKDKLRELCMTQTEYGNAIGIKQGQLSAYLNQKQFPNIEILLKIAKYSNVTVEDLVNYNSTLLKSTEAKIINLNTGNGNFYNAAGNININPQIKTKNNYSPGPNDISATQAGKIKELVDSIVNLEEQVKIKPKSYAAVYKALHRKYGVTYYRELKRDQYDDVVNYLYKWQGRLKNTKTFTANKDVWRKDKYKAINTISKKELMWDNDKLKSILTQSFGVNSLRDLTDDEITKFYNYVVRKKREKK